MLIQETLSEAFISLDNESFMSFFLKSNKNLVIQNNFCIFATEG